MSGTCGSIRDQPGFQYLRLVLYILAEFVRSMENRQNLLTEFRTYHSGVRLSEACACMVALQVGEDGLLLHEGELIDVIM